MRKIRVMATIIILISIFMITLPLERSGLGLTDPIDQSSDSQESSTRAIPVTYGSEVIKLEANTNTSGLTFQLQKNSTVIDASITIEGLPTFDHRVWSPAKVITKHTFDGESESPSIGLDSKDTLYLCWMDSGPFGNVDGDDDIFYAKNRGTTWVPFNLVSTAKAEHSRWPEIFIDQKDYLHIVWVDKANIDNNDKDQDIFYRNITASTGDMTATNLINKEIGFGTSTQPKVAVNDSGDVFIVWQDNGTYIRNNSKYSDILCRIWYQQNQTWSSIFNLSDSSHEGNSTDPEIATDGTSVYVVWTTEGDYAGSGLDNDIFFCAWDGSTWSEPRLSSDNLSDGQSNNASVYAKNGMICITWDDDGNIDNSSTDLDIILQKFTSDGWSGSDVVSDHLQDGNSTNPQVMIDEDDNIHVVWVEDGKIRADNEDTDIIYRQYDSKLVEWSNLTVISDLQNDRKSVEPQISVTENGKIEVVWTDYGDIDLSGTDADIIYRSTKPHYPTNLKLKVGPFNGGDYDYSIEGELIGEVILNQSWLKDKLNGLITTMTTSIDDYHLIFNSDTIGCIEIKNFELIITSPPLLPTGLRLIDEEATHVVSHKPTFSWNFMDNDSKVQGGFEIEVGSTPGSNDMWSYISTINRDEYINEFIDYDGSPLIDKVTYYFRVKVKDEDGAWSRWSENYEFKLNSRPFIEYISPDSGTFDEYVDIEWLGLDPDGDNLNYTLQAYYNGTWHTLLDDKPATQFKLNTKGINSFQYISLRLKCSDGFEESKEWFYIEEEIEIIHNSPPYVRIHRPDKNGDIANEYFRIEWESFDLDPNDELTVDLYYDNNKDFSAKEMIVNDLPDIGFYIWNTADVDQGEYYICIDITDGKSSNYTYSDGLLEINHDINTNPPHVVETVPKADAQNVKLTQEIRVEFSKPMNQNTLTHENIIIKDSQGNIVKGSIIPDNFELIFIPEGNLKTDQIYTVTLKAGIRDSSGKFLDGNRDYLSSNTAEDDYTWSFFTIPGSEDTIPPYILSVTPEDIKTEISVSSPYVSAIFSEELDSSSLILSPAYVYDEFGNIVDTELIFYPEENKLRIEFYGDLNYGTKYIVLITAEARDKVGHGLDGNMNGISEGAPMDNYQWSFTTEQAKSSTNGAETNDKLDASIIYSISLILIILIIIIAFFVVKKQLKRHKFNIHDIFVVYHDGRLLAHQSFESISNVEESAMGGMLTAIQNFILESFRNNDTEKLDEIVYGNLKIVLTHGKHVYIAAVCTGDLPGRKFNKDLSNLVSLIELKFGKVLVKWDGNMKKVREIGDLIRF
jgi:hypothetical protein